jgi:two-component system, response regulator
MTSIIEYPEVLLVEDREEDATLTIRALKKYNLINDIKWLEDGQHALDYLFGTGPEKITQAIPKLILLDLKLPRVNGLEVLEQIKASEALRTIPVIIMTSSKEDVDIKKAYQLGANSYIVKPIDFGNFADAVKQLGMYWLILNEPLKPTQK